MKKVIVFLCLILLSSCASDNSSQDPTIIERLNNNDYSMILPFVASEVRQYHGTYLGRADFLEIGSRLEDKSKEYFNVNDYYLSEGQVITNNELTRLVRRESTDNPYGLNPPSGSEFLVGTSDITVVDAVVVADVVELDFYQQSGGEIKLAGMSFAIVLNQSLSSADGLINVSDQVLYDYGSNMGRKLDRYI
ncbi:MAG: CamS family sex pheromone protein, partial [Ignavibacteria bacterium]|nr:CamS family sex pheromone protein [Ignavibacteria bacterium]